jgi:hypothetical protein
MVPAWYMAGAIVIGLVAIVLVDESAPVKTGARLTDVFL